MGLVNEVFTHDILEPMKGDIGVGHVRYSTAGSSTDVYKRQSCFQTDVWS